MSEETKKEVKAPKSKAAIDKPAETPATDKATETGLTVLGLAPAKVIDNGKGKLILKAPKRAYYDFMEARQLNKDVVDAVHSAHEALRVEMAKTATEEAVRRGGSCKVVVPYFNRVNAFGCTVEDIKEIPERTSKLHGQETKIPAHTRYAVTRFSDVFKLPKNEELKRFATEAEVAIKANSRKALKL